MHALYAYDVDLDKRLNAKTKTTGRRDHAKPNVGNLLALRGFFFRFADPWRVLYLIRE